MSRKLRVLIVEDNEDDVALLLRALRQSGFDVTYERVESASSMQQALTEKVWDIVISDYNMPRFNALDALAILKATGQDLPFLLISGTITEEMAVAGMRAGAHDYLMKGNLTRLGPAVDRELQEATNREQRQRAERELRISDERFRATFNQAAVGIGHVDFDGRWVLVNQKLCTILGYTAEELIGHRVQEITHPTDLENNLAHRQQLIEGKIDTCTGEKRYLRKDGSTVWTNLTTSVVRDTQGEPQYFINVIEDISERKQAQLKIEGLNARLKRAMYETHHRVRNNLQILTAIIDEYQTGQKPIGQKELKRLTNVVTTLSLVHDLLTIRAREDAEASRLSTSEILEHLLSLLVQAAPERSIHYTIDDVLLPTDPATSLALIINELVSNSFKYSQGTIQVVFEAKGGMAKLMVEDEGPGFPADFDPCRPGQTGLELVEGLRRTDLKGETRYENCPGKGARVTVKFPLPA